MAKKITWQEAMELALKTAEEAQKQREEARRNNPDSRLTNITFVGSTCGDWEGMYIDGRLVFENHSITGRLE